MCSSDLLRHELGLGVLASRYRQRMGLQAYNWAGVGTVDGGTVVPAAPDTLDQNTERTERNTEWQLTDRIALGDWGLWLGLRHTDLHRESVRTDGSRPTAYSQGFTTPWLASTWQLTPQDMVYASWGRGVESAVTPNKPAYGAAAGQAQNAVNASARPASTRKVFMIHSSKRFGRDGVAISLYFYTCRKVSVPHFAQFGYCRLAFRPGQRAAGVKHAAARRIERAGHFAAEHFRHARRFKGRVEIGRAHV